MALPKELHTHLVGPQVAAQLVVVAAKFNNATAGDATEPNVFVAPRKMRFVGGSYVQSANATAATSFTAQLKVGATAISEALDIKTLGADAPGYFVGSVVSADRTIAKGAQVDVVFDETGGTVTAPADVTVCLEFQLLE